MSETQRSHSDVSFPVWLAAIVILGASLMALGGVIALVRPAMLISANDPINGAVHVYAGYLVSRNLALAAMLLVMLAIRARRALSTLMILTALIQVADAAMDFAEGRWPLVPGVLVFATAYFIGAARLSERPWWSMAAWRS